MEVDRLESNLLEIVNLTKHFLVKKGLIFQSSVGQVRAVDDVSFAIKPGKTLGLVGESGSGKTTISKMILGLYRPDSGQIFFKGTDLASSQGSKLRSLRRSIGAVFQDPYASLDPRMTIADIVTEPMIVHNYLTAQERRLKLLELLEKVGLRQDDANRYPHQFSGGQRQRIAIARALALSPELVISDEAVSALDVSVQGKIVNLLMDLQEELGLSYLFIGHDLNVVKQVSDEIAVMYLGRIVERGNAQEIFRNPRHPYTQALIAAIPVADPKVMRARQLLILQGEMPSALSPIGGCRFNSRCKFAQDVCRSADPPLLEVDPGHFVACHFEAQIPRMASDD